MFVDNSNTQTATEVKKKIAATVHNGESIGKPLCIIPYVKRTRLKWDFPSRSDYSLFLSSTANIL